MVHVDYFVYDSDQASSSVRGRNIFGVYRKPMPTCTWSYLQKQHTFCRCVHEHNSGQTDWLETRHYGCSCVVVVLKIVSECGSPRKPAPSDVEGKSESQSQFSRREQPSYIYASSKSEACNVSNIARLQYPRAKTLSSAAFLSYWSITPHRLAAAPDYIQCINM